MDVKTIVVGEASPGNIVYAVHNEKPYEAKVLRMAGKLTELAFSTLNRMFLSKNISFGKCSSLLSVFCSW